MLVELCVRACCWVLGGYKWACVAAGYQGGKQRGGGGGRANQRHQPY